MSQTNAFYKAQNPDYVYLDMQQSNVYNNTTGADVDVNFIETRDSPVINNTGEYVMSVTRFQIDSYNLPTLVVEPDLTQGNVNKTVHKVAIMTESATQLNPGAVSPISTTTLSSITAPNVDTKFGSAIAYAEDLNMAVIGAPLAVTGYGAIYYAILTGSAPSITELPVFGTLTLTSGLGQSVATTKSGNIIVTIRRNANTTVNTLELFYWKRSGNNYQNPIVSELSTIGSTVTTTDNVIRISNNATSLNSLWSNIAIVGCPTLSTAYIYSLSSDGNIFTTQATSYTAFSDAKLGASVAISSDSSVIAIGNPMNATNLSVGVRIMEWSASSSSYVSRLDYVSGAGTTRNIGFALAMSADGRFIVSGAPLDNNNLGRVDIFKKTAANTWQHQQILNGVTAQMKFGHTVAISDDGLVLTVGFGNSTSAVNANIYVRSDDSENFIFGTVRGTVPQGPARDAIITNSTGTRLLMGRGPTIGTGSVVFEAFNSNVPHYIDYLPATLRNIASVASVMWEPTSNNSPTELNLLTGKTTVENPYYWCYSYDYFCGLVNKALEQATAANYNYLYDQWITASGTTNETKAIFFDAAYKSFPTPPFLDWEHDTLKASMYVNHCYNRFSAPNYAVPGITWSGSTGTVAVPPPFAFRVALNPSLYALFNSFPATETLLTTTTGTVEKFYVLNINSSGYPVITPNPTIQKTLYSSYVFNSLIYNLSNFTYVLSPTTTVVYPYAAQFIQVHQELSTIDTWSPVNGIVFTTNTLPIVTNQFSANSVINSDRPSFETGAQYALIITDLQTNEQGYKPNLLYNPTAEYRRIDMTGNRGLTNIDIRVFWRAKTGQLIPFKLSSGVSASIKILFQKKILGEKQQMQLAQTIKELDGV